MTADISSGSGLHELASPSFFKPYFIVNDKGDLESTHLIRWCYEKICGAFNGRDMCDSKLVSLSLVRKLMFMSEQQTFGSHDFEDIKKIAARAGLTASITEKEVLSAKDLFFQQLELVNGHSKQEISNGLKEILAADYKANKKELKRYPKELRSLFKPKQKQSHAYRVSPSSGSDDTVVLSSQASSSSSDVEGGEGDHQLLPQEITDAVDEVRAEITREAKKDAEADSELSLVSDEDAPYSEIPNEDGELADYDVELGDYDDDTEGEKLPGDVNQRVCRRILAKEIAKENKQLVETLDTGDCFYHAFAIGLSDLLGREVTMQDIRNSVHLEAEKLYRENPEGNWVKQKHEQDILKLDSYDTYRTLVGKSAQTLEEEAASGQQRQYPVWGRPNVEGELLCKHYNVQLRVTGVHVDEAEPKLIPEKFSIEEGKDCVYPKREPLSKPAGVVDIASYPGHFLGTVKKANT